MKTKLARRLGVIGRGRGLEEVVDDSFRLVITGAGVVVLLTVSLLAWLLLYSRPSIARYERGATGLADSYAAMLNQSLAIRGYLPPVARSSSSRTRPGASTSSRPTAPSCRWRGTRTSPATSCPCT